MHKRFSTPCTASGIGVSLLLLMLIFAACGSSVGNSNSVKNDNVTSKTSKNSTATSTSTDIEPNVSSASQITSGSQSCPATVSNPAHWDPIIPTQSGVSAVSRVICANLTGKSTLQALIIVSYDGASSVKDVYVFDNITGPSPTQLFKLQNLIQGDAKISGYNTVLTAEVDPNSSESKNAGGANAQHPDLFREFKWSDGAGTLVQVPFPGLFPVLTRYQADFDQQQVNEGHQPWQISASMTAQALAANLLKWAPDSPATIVQGGGKQDVNAVVDVKSTNPGGGTIRVALSRLYGNTNGGIWIATGVSSPGLSITAPAPLDRLTSPLNVAGTTNAINGKAGTVRILDHTETDIGHADVQPSQSTGSATYNVTVSYNTTFKTGSQEGIVALYVMNAGGNAIAGAVMEKVLLG